MKRVIRLFTGLALLASSFLVLGSSVAHATSTQRDFKSRPFPITRDGHRYWVTMHVSRTGTSDSFYVDVSEKTNPDGVSKTKRTEAFGSQKITKFTSNADLSSAAVVLTPGDSASRAHIDMTWTPTDPLRTSCQSHVRTRKGRFDGTFSFNTKTSLFGTIKTDVLRGKIEVDDGGVCNSPPPNTACPPLRQTALIYSGAASVITEKYSNEKSAFYGGGYEDQAGDGWYRSHSISGRMPKSYLAVSEDLTTAIVQMPENLFIYGVTRFSTSQSPNNSPWSECGSFQESSDFYTSGEWDDGLTLDFLLGEDTHFLNGFGSIGRTFVREVV